MAPPEKRSRRKWRHGDAALDLISQMVRTQDLLAQEIALTEHETKISNPTHPQYSNIALDAARRRKKLRASVSFLKLWMNLHSRDHGHR